MRVKTPRHDELLEVLAAGKYGWKTYFEEAIQLAEKLEFENIALQQQLEQAKCCANCGALESCERDGCDHYKYWRPRQ